jgi:ABC-type Mn2+/Zn2+ transport system permease subunit
MLITPAATGYLLARRLPAMLAVAAFVGVFSGIAGLYISYYVAISSGAAIVLAATACFGVAWVVSRARGG